MRSVILLFAVIVLLAVLVISLGQNADEPGAAIAIGVMFGVFAAVPVGLGIALYRRDNAPSQPAQYVTHQHLHVYQVDDQGRPIQISEASREIVVTR